MRKPLSMKIQRMLSNYEGTNDQRTSTGGTNDQRTIELGRNQVDLTGLSNKEFQFVYKPVM